MVPDIVFGLVRAQSADQAKLTVAGRAKQLPPITGGSWTPRIARGVRRRMHRLLFEAAHQGCQHCVAHYLDVEKLDPLSESENSRYMRRREVMAVPGCLSECMDT